MSKRNITNVHFNLYIRKNPKCVPTVYASKSESSTLCTRIFSSQIQSFFCSITSEIQEFHNNK